MKTYRTITKLLGVALFASALAPLTAAGGVRRRRRWPNGGQRARSVVISPAAGSIRGVRS